MALSRLERRKRIKLRVRKNIKGDSVKPRLSVFRSNKEIYAQIIDDVTGVTLVSSSSREKTIEKTNENTKSQVATLVGQNLAKKALDKGISNVCFDRNGFLYHGRVKSLADGAREAGLKF